MRRVLLLNLGMLLYLNGYSSIDSILIEAEKAKMKNSTPTIKREDAIEYIILDKISKESIYYDIDINRTGEYELYIRHIAKSGTSDSIFIRVDNQEEHIWDINYHSNRWHWSNVTSRKYKNPLRFFLKKGRHKIYIRAREKGVMLDKILLSYIKLYKKSVEAESGNVIKLFSTIKDTLASGGGYIVTKNGGEGIMEYKFYIPKRDTYKIFAKYIATNNLSDSFFISLDKKKYDIWDISPHSKSWNWTLINSRKDRKNSFFFRKGLHTLRIKGRERDVKLDRLIITNYKKAPLKYILNSENRNIQGDANYRNPKTYYVSNSGDGYSCEKSNPCSLYIGLKRLEAGDRLLLFGGVYHIDSGLSINSSGRVNRPITISSVPNQKAILDGGAYSKDDVKDNRVGIAIYNQDYINIENIEIRNMSGEGISITGSHNRVSHCNIHNNFASGIAVVAMDIYGKRCNSCKIGFNIIENNRIYNNSGADIFDKQRSDGENADGVSIASGQNNIVRDNLIFGNSDDGVDTWNSKYTKIINNIIYNNGKGKNGDGNGIKAGGYRGVGTFVEHNIVYNNRATGIHYNLAKDVTIQYNTSFNNGDSGFKSSNSTTVRYNISYRDGKKSEIKAKHYFNSWQMDRELKFLSLNPKSPNFLKLEDVNDIGAFGGY